VTLPAKRATKKRSTSAKSKKKAKTAVKRGKAVVSTARKKASEYPISETLAWVADGEKLLRKWGAIKSPLAKKIANGFEKVLSVLETVNELRKM
jgi:hypothetical protein